ncbi:MAG: MFS transporter [Dermatophilaceae bacterium]
MTSLSPEAAVGAAPRARTLLTFASIAVALAAADTYVVVLALTDMMQGVGLGIEHLQQAAPIISGFLLGYVAVLPLIGRLADLVDRQRVLLGCLAIFVAGSIVTALAVELPVLVAGRVVQGIGGGGLVPATLAIVAALWPEERRGLPLGVVGAVQELGSVLGPVLGALILAVADWRAIFWLNAIGGVVLAVLIARAGGGVRWRVHGIRLGVSVLAALVLGLALWAPAAVTDSVTLGVPFVPFGTMTSRLATPVGVVGLALAALALVWALRASWPVLREAHPVGAALLGGMLGCIVLTFASSDPEKEVVGPLGFALLPLGIVLGIAYAVVHRRSPNPVIPRGVVRGRTIWALAVSLMVGIALVAVVVDIPLLARLIHDSDTSTRSVATEGALVLVRFLLAVPVGALLGGWVLRWAGDGLVAALGLVGAAAGLAILSTYGRDSFSGLSSYAVLALTGIGVGLALAPVNNAALAQTPQAAHGTASALVVVARMVGMVVGIALLTAFGLHHYYQVVAAMPDPSDKTALVDAGISQVHYVFRGATVAAVIGALVAPLLGLRRHAPVGGRQTFGL